MYVKNYGYSTNKMTSSCINVLKKIKVDNYCKRVSTHEALDTNRANVGTHSLPPD